MNQFEVGKIRKILVKCSYKYAIYAKVPPFWVIFEVKNMEFPTGIVLILGSKICKFPTFIWWSFPGPATSLASNDMSDMLNLNCWVLGDNPQHVLSVKIVKSEMVDALNKAIME